MAGGLEGVCLGAAALWFVASLGDTLAARAAEVAAHRAGLAEAKRRTEWVAQAEAAEAALQAALNTCPGSLEELRSAIRVARHVGVESRAQQLMR
jgi:transcriptional regulator GlxA family with amidase domain